LTHIWVGYEGKPENDLENLEASLIIVNQEGETRLSLPRADLKRSWRTFYQGFWEVMPGGKKLLVFAGFPIIFGLSRPGRFA